MATAIELLTTIRNQFPQADPNHEDYDSGIDGGDAVDFICVIMPQIIELLDRPAPKVAVILHAGSVQDIDIVSNRPEEVSATLMVVSYDTAHDADEHLYEIPQGDGSTETAYAHTEEVYPSGIDLDALHADISNREG